MPTITDAGDGDGRKARIPESALWFPLPPHPIAAEQARLLTKIALAEWNLLDLADSALLIAAELVTNAMKIGEVFRMTLSRHGGGAVLIEIWDGSEAPPDRRCPSVDRVDGRGLMLLEACAKDWGWRLEDDGGKTVWAIVGGTDAAGGTAPSCVAGA